jgi:hypothetical protein
MIEDDPPETLPATVEEEVDPKAGLDRWGRDKDGLTPLSRRFCEEYLVDLNAAAAARRAGYSEENAADQGYDNLRKKPIVEHIARLMAARSDKVDISATWVLGRLAHMEKGLSELPDAIKDVAARRDRIRLLELIGKHVDVRAFRTQFGVGGPNGEPLGTEWDFTRLSDEELDEFERLLAKVTVRRDAEGREGAADQGAGPRADQE